MIDKNGTPLITVVVPSFNQGNFLEQALSSIFDQNLPVEVFVMDGGSTDKSLEVICKWEKLLSGWRSHPDAGQAAAINEGVSLGSAPYVCWLNSDDFFLPNGLSSLFRGLENSPELPMVYGRAWNIENHTGNRRPVWVEPFSANRLALRCIISQPATLIRRTIWEHIGGVDTNLYMAMDYDLWWRIFKAFGTPIFLDQYVAANRNHANTKTNTNRALHYREAINVVRKYHGTVPIKWWLLQPYAVWFKSVWPI
jgi:hypothetical protein